MARYKMTVVFAVTRYSPSESRPRSTRVPPPVVAETYDGWLSTSGSFPLKTEDAFAAFDSAIGGGPIAEGSVGGGTGMICHEFKGGTGTASRVVVEGGTR